MKALQQNPFLTGLILVVVAGCAGLGFLLAGAMTEFEENSLRYQQSVQKLHQLQNRVPFPDAANVKQAEELRDHFRAELDGLRADIAKLQKPINTSVTPPQFQDELRTAVNAIVAKAEASKVGLPENFAFGFDQYLQTPPRAEAAPALSRQLQFIVGIVNELIGPNPENPGIRSVDSLFRVSLPEETAPTAPRGDATPGEDAIPAIAKYPFAIGFTAEQGKFRILYNSLIKSDQFLIVRALTIENSNTEGPPVAAAEGTEATSPLAALTGETQPQAKETLNVLLGRELLHVRLGIEMVDFNFPAPEAGATAEAATP